MARRLRRGLEEERKPRIEIRHEEKGTGTRLSTKQAEYSDSEVLGAVPDVDWWRLTQKLTIAGAMMRHGTLGAGQQRVRSAMPASSALIFRSPVRGCEYSMMFDRIHVRLKSVPVASVSSGFP